jgi:hypothetical protein
VLTLRQHSLEIHYPNNSNSQVFVLIKKSNFLHLWTYYNIITYMMHPKSLTNAKALDDTSVVYNYSADQELHTKEPNG